MLFAFKNISQRRESLHIILSLQNEFKLKIHTGDTDSSIW